MKKNLRNLMKLLNLLLIILTGILTTLLLKTNIIPLKYLVPTLAILIAFLLIITYITLSKKSKFISKLITTISMTLLIIILTTVIYYLYNTLDFINNIKTKEYQLEEYYVVVLKESGYEYFNDIAGKTMGIYNNNISKYNDSLNTTIKNTSIKLKEYNNYYEAGLSLLNKQVESIYISSTYKEILDDKLSTFKNQTKILKKDLQKIEKEQQTEKKDISSNSFNIYISGIDTYGNISSVSRSDVNMIMTINPKTNKILLTSIPRDYYVKLPGTTGYKDKLTHAGMYGIDMSISTIEYLLDIKIDYYIRVNFTTLVNIVDAINGIDVYSDTNFRAHTNKKCSYQKGTNHLDGKCALAYARERYAYQEGDRHRVKNQQDIVKAIMNKGLSSKTFITKYTEILKQFQNSFEMSIPQEIIYELINKQLDTMPNWEIEQISLDGYDSYNYTYSYPGGKLYVMEPNVNTINTTNNKIKEYSN